MSKLDLLKMLSEGGRDALKYFYGKAADQANLPVAKRIQPDPSRARIMDTDYGTPADMQFSEDLGSLYPRNPNPAAPLPLGDRGRVLVDRRKEIADRLVEKIRGSGVLDTDARYFYHSDGPIYRAAINAGLSPAEARAYLDDFATRFAATSPRTPVEPNIKNATSVMAKEAAGVPHREILGPGTIDAKTGKPGISEKGYPMMTGKGGIHGILLDNVQQYGMIDRATNTKPATFGANMVGNRSGVTADTHAIRGALMALNDIAPGSIPDGFIVKEALSAYKKDPTKVTPDMLHDTVGTQMVDIDGRRVQAQTEYPVFADIYHLVAKDLGVDPAEAQALGWFGLGDETNLASARKTVSEVFDERINVTAKALGLTPQEVAKLVFNRKIPVMSLLGGAMVTQGQTGGGDKRGIIDYLEGNGG